MNIEEKARAFAEGKALTAFNRAIEEAYAQGYLEGYKDGQEDVPVELMKTKTEFVNLGLPSGTEWAADNDLDNDGFTIYAPYCKAEKENLPTVEQFQELIDTCVWQTRRNNAGTFEGYVVIGPNGNQIKLFAGGYYEADIKYSNDCNFWLKSNDEENDQKIAACCSVSNNLRSDTYFSGYKLPIRQIRIHK
jgi:hypothetical protein